MPRRISTEREQFWRHHIDQPRVSQTTIREYCRNHGLLEHSFHSCAPYHHRTRSADIHSATFSANSLHPCLSPCHRHRRPDAD